MVESMDKSLGDFLDLLEELGIAENTIILFMSDNGSAKHSPINKPLRGHKLLPYEGGIRVPMIAKWPGVTPAGSECGEYMMIDDMFPTILELAGLTNYEQPGGKVDGCSFVPLLKGTKGHPKDRTIVWHYPHSYDQFPYSVIRKGDWKLIYFHRDQHYELYNIAQDIGEEKDLYKEQRRIANRLADELGEYLRETEAQMPVIKKTGKPVPIPGKRQKAESHS
jgi:arylsulfatase A-like enzyme